MMDDGQPLNVWQWFEERSWQYLPMHDGYQSPTGRYFINQHICYRYPGDIIYFLKTGFIRNIEIFDNGFTRVRPEHLGLKAHKDGRCVELRRVK